MCSIKEPRHGNVTLAIDVQDKAVGEVLHSACFTFAYLCACECGCSQSANSENGFAWFHHYETSVRLYQ